MSIRRIVIVSNARPARVWNVTERIAREIPGAQVAGVVQRSQRRLPRCQQLLSPTTKYLSQFHSKWLFNINHGLLSLLVFIRDSLLWCIHGCPRGVGWEQFNTDKLSKKCRQIEYPILVWDDLHSKKVWSFITDQEPDLVILLGDYNLNAELLKCARCGGLRAVQRVVQDDGPGARKAIAFTIEFLAPGLQSKSTIAHLTFPVQPYDVPLAVTLKADLISDDLILKTAKHVLTETVVKATNIVTDWVQQMFSPYLEQLNSTSLIADENRRTPERHRSILKLCLDTLLLCSPLIVARNAYRRMRQQYPVTILTHHLVSDRPHRMGICTESFWRQIRFLQRHYRIVSLTEAIELLKSGRIEAPTVVLTFDDGYADNFINLRAVAEDAGVPITLFVATEPVEQQYEFHHDLENGIRGALPLTWKQVLYWSTSRIELGAHTRTHFDCGSNDVSRLRCEIAGSKDDLELHLGKRVDFFAFPFGHEENMSAEGIEIAKGFYSYFVSGFGGQNQCTNRKDDQHLLRKNLYANAWEQELDLQSVFDLVDRSKRMLRRWHNSPRHLPPVFASGVAERISEARSNVSN